MDTRIIFIYSLHKSAGFKHAKTNHSWISLVNTPRFYGKIYKLLWITMCFKHGKNHLLWITVEFFAGGFSDSPRKRTCQDHSAVGSFEAKQTMA